MATLTYAAIPDQNLSALVASCLDEAGLAGTACAVVHDLATMRCGAVNAAENVYPASVIKVPIMAEAFRQYSIGALEPSRRITVTQSNQTTTWGGPTPFQPGAKPTVAELVERMITHSDNVATNQLMDVLRRERVTHYMRALGLSTFFLGRKLSGSEPLIEDPEQTGRNRLPPAEIAHLLALIALDAVPGAAEQREILRRCAHDEKLVQGLNPRDVFMHKTGETSEQSHDAGILELDGGGRYVVVLYTSPAPKGDDSDADHINPQMAQWMRLVRARLVQAPNVVAGA